MEKVPPRLEGRRNWQGGDLRENLCNRPIVKASMANDLGREANALFGVANNMLNLPNFCLQDIVGDLVDVKKRTTMEQLSEEMGEPFERDGDLIVPDEDVEIISETPEIGPVETTEIVNVDTPVGSGWRMIVRSMADPTERTDRVEEGVVCSPVSPATGSDPVAELLRNVSSLLAGTPIQTAPERLKLSDLRVHAGGIMWVILNFLQEKGDVGVAPSDVQWIKESLPNLPEKNDIVLVVIATIQALSCTRRAREVFEGWARQEGKMVMASASGGATKGPILSPWKSTELWSFGTWALAAQITERFLEQGIVTPEAAFGATLGDLYAVVGKESWAIEAVIFTLYALKGARWFWDVLFNSRVVMIKPRVRSE